MPSSGRKKCVYAPFPPFRSKPRRRLFDALQGASDKSISGRTLSRNRIRSRLGRVSHRAQFNHSFIRSFPKSSSGASLSASLSALMKLSGTKVFLGGSDSTRYPLLAGERKTIAEIASGRKSTDVVRIGDAGSSIPCAHTTPDSQLTSIEAQSHPTICVTRKSTVAAPPTKRADQRALT